MTGDDDWSDLRAAWQARPVDDAGAIARLRADVAAARRRMLIETILEVAVSLGSAAVLLWWASGASGAARAVLLGLAILAVVMQVLTLLLRRRLWRARGETLASYRRFLAAQARLGLWFAMAGIIAAPAGVATGLWLAGGFDFGALPGLTAVAAIAGAALIAGWLWAFREAARYRRLLASLGREPED